MKDQYLGQLRVLLTALGAALTAWGVSDGQKWEPIIGILVMITSLGWGVWHHTDPFAPGRLSWSLARKCLNAIGAAAVTYGFLHPGKVESILAVIGALGPILAARWSWIDNADETAASPPPSAPNGMIRSLLWLPFLGLLSAFLVGCADMAVRGTVFIADPASGAKAGMTADDSGRTYFGRLYDSQGNLIGGGSILIPVDPASGK